MLSSGKGSWWLRRTQHRCSLATRCPLRVTSGSGPPVATGTLPLAAHAAESQGVKCKCRRRKPVGDQPHSPSAPPIFRFRLGTRPTPRAERADARVHRHTLGGCHAAGHGHPALGLQSIPQGKQAWLAPTGPDPAELSGTPRFPHLGAALHTSHRLPTHSQSLPGS